MPTLDRKLSTLRSFCIARYHLTKGHRYKGIASNRFKANWNIQNIPALCRFQSKDGKVMETGRLVEAELLDEARVHTLIEAMDI